VLLLRGVELGVDLGPELVEGLLGDGPL